MWESNTTSLLQIGVIGSRSSVTVVLGGDIDTLTAPQLDAALRGVVESGTGQVVVDMAAVDFIDSVGVRALVQARAVLAEQGRAFVCTAMSSSVTPLLELFGLVEAA